MQFLLEERAVTTDIIHKLNYSDEGFLVALASHNCIMKF